MSSKTLSSMPEGIRNAMVRLAKKFVYSGVLARIKEHQEAYEGVGEFRFDQEEEVKGKRWDSFDNLVADADAHSDKVTHPVTISTEAAYALVVPFLAISNVINGAVSRAPGGDKLPVGAVEMLNQASGTEAAVMRATVAIRSHMGPLIGTGLMAREYDAPRSFRDKLEALVSSKALAVRVGPATIGWYIDFLKCVAWKTGNAVWITKKFTLNYEQVLLILTDFRACCPADADVSAMVNDVMDQVNNVVTVQERAAEDAKERKVAAAKKASAEKKAAAEKKAGGAAAPEKKAGGAAAEPKTKLKPGAAAAEAKTPPTPAPKGEEKKAEAGRPLAAAKPRAPAGAPPSKVNATTLPSKLSAAAVAAAAAATAKPIATPPNKVPGGKAPAPPAALKVPPKGKVAPVAAPVEMPAEEQAADETKDDALDEPEDLEDMADPPLDEDKNPEDPEDLEAAAESGPDVAEPQKPPAPKAVLNGASNGANGHAVKPGKAAPAKAAPAKLQTAEVGLIVEGLNYDDMYDTLAGANMAAPQ